jgi:3-deoxy-7-phosphoheptulonate synthase
MSGDHEPYALKRVLRSSADQKSRVRVGDLVIGEAFVVIAGPCAVEDASSLEAVAGAVVAAGAHALRGGAFKPRTSPYAFRGLGAEGARLLGDVGGRHKRPVVSEVMSSDQLPVLLPHVDMLQIGARNMQNFDLLRAVATAGRPVLLKRGFGNTVDEWLAAAEHLLDAGANDVVLCERGVRSGVDAVRFTLDIGAVLVAKERTHLPVLVDPSHATGRRDFVPSMALAAAVAGADGLIVEVHDDPARAKSDGPQALTPPMFASLMQRLAAVLAVEGKALAAGKSS